MAARSARTVREDEGKLGCIAWARVEAWHAIPTLDADVQTEGRMSDVESQHLSLVWERRGGGCPLLFLPRAGLEPRDHPAGARGLARRGKGRGDPGELHA